MQGVTKVGIKDEGFRTVVFDRVQQARHVCFFLAY
jgi:hypothetical protein